MEELNLVDMECPEPFLKTAAKLMTMKKGSIKVVFKDPKCDDMIMEALKLMECKIISHVEKNGIFEIVIEKEDKKTNNEKVDEKLGLGNC
ncbi:MULTISPECIES: sulfurtransferase TusA family protein [Acidianus]|uniref:Oxidoreductase n=1 Tax=Candidatus Acidianus copahuensis TaxID=1160895 RepID=A0A031LQI5_9CREN|nr:MULTISPECIES: sulfurtransferase TusA family protein [Acidianus]EZQ07015.1 oxidoreductase [Candidatus Acidianus copahuensis]NON61174.1 sulfurtransferase TusA family protein [Acidianus sp. RZ1]